MNIRLFAGAQWTPVDPQGAVDELTGIKDVLEFDEATIFSASMSANLNPQGAAAVLSIDRQAGAFLDEVKLTWPDAPHEHDARFARFAGMAHRLLGALHFPEPSPNLVDERMSAAHAAILEKLETTAARSIELTQKRLQEIEGELALRKQALDQEVAGERERLDALDAKRLEALAEKERALLEREKSIDLRDNTLVRRDLLTKLLERVAGQESSLQLSQPTQAKRRPIINALILGGVVVLLAFAHGLWQLTEVIGGGNTWLIGWLLLKQLALAGVFLAGVWWYIGWQDKWFREHADNEFRLKQLHLDFRRASWLVETVLEWESQKVPIPEVLLDRLSTGLFVARPPDAGPAPPPPTLASLLVPNADRIRARLPGGAEVELDGKGAKRVQEEISRDGS